MNPYVHRLANHDGGGEGTELSICRWLAAAAATPAALTSSLANDISVLSAAVYENAARTCWWRVAVRAGGAYRRRHDKEGDRAQKLLREGGASAPSRPLQHNSTRPRSVLRTLGKPTDVLFHSKYRKYSRRSMLRDTQSFGSSGWAMPSAILLPI